MIPLLWLWPPNKRTANTRWCGSCGAQYWREGKGAWQKERRATWVDTLSGEGDEKRGARRSAHKPFGIRANKLAEAPTPADGC
jgi:hypothetical protein